MTVDQFVTRLSKTKGPWFLVAGGMIRCTRGVYHCPVERVANLRHAFSEAGPRLRLSLKAVSAIVEAADDAPMHDKHLRRRLLRACGLA